MRGGTEFGGFRGGSCRGWEGGRMGLFVKRRIELIVMGWLVVSKILFGMRWLFDMPSGQ